MKNNTVHFHHIRNAGRRKNENFTLAILPTENTVYVGISKCAAMDSFVKAKGRKIAEGRARKAAAIAENPADFTPDTYVTWSIEIPRKDYGLESEKIKREVIEIAKSEIRVIQQRRSE